MFDNLVFYDAGALMYLNGGKLKNFGTELSLHYTGKKFQAEGNLTWQRVVEAVSYQYAMDNNMANIPAFMSNVVLQYEVLKGLKFHTHLTAYGRQYSRTTNFFTNEVTEHELPGRVIVNLGVNYAIKNFGVGLNCYNLLNTKYEQGGVSTGFIRQQGLWLRAEISYKF